MYKFQSNNPKSKKSIDGFLASGPRNPKFKPANKRQLERNLPSFGNQRRLEELDNFNKADGFRGRSLPQINQQGRYSALNQSREKQKFHDYKPSIIKPKKDRKLKIFARVAMVAMAILIIFSGFMVGKAWWSAHRVFRGGGTALAFDKNIDPHMLNGEGDGRVNILLMGKGGATEAAGGDLTDSLLIMSIDPINTSVTMLSVPRDLWVSPSGLWPMKINAVYTSAKGQMLNKNPKNQDAAELAGINKLNGVVEQYLGVHMHYWAMIDFSAFEEAVNTLGGINVYLPEAYSDYTMLVGNRYLNLPAGWQHLDGGMALAYARSRHGAARGDFDRGSHQQTVLVGIKDKIMSSGTYSNPIKVSQLLGTFGNRVRTSLSIDDMMRVYGIAKQLNSGNIKHADLAQEGQAVVKTGAVGDQSVVLPIAGVNDFTKVKAFVRTKLKDGFIIKENPRIVVLNGTDTVGLAQKRADELKGYGYNVVQVGDATVKNIQSTTFIDLTRGTKKYTKRYIEQRLGTTAVDSVDGLDLSQYKTTADFIIIIGPQG